MCLIDYIGFQNCSGQTVPQSAMYINTLPGISLESIDKIANQEQITYLKVWNDAQAEAFIRFKNDFMIELNKCFTLNRNCDYDEMICDNIEFIAVAWRYLLGNQLMIYRLTSSRLNRYTTIDKQQAEDLKNFYQTEYENALSVSMKLIDVSSCCQMEETNNPMRVWQLP